MEHVWVTELEDGEVSEDNAVTMVAPLGCGSLEIRLAAGGRANLFATQDCCVLIDDDLLKQINCTASIVISTLANFSFAKAGQRICTVKSAPFAIAHAQLEAVVSILKERGPILQARPIREPSVAVLYRDPVCADRAKQLFDSIMRQRLEKFGIGPAFALATVEDEGNVAVPSSICSAPNQPVFSSLLRLPLPARKIPSAAQWLKSAATWNASLPQWSPATSFC